MNVPEMVAKRDTIAYSLSRQRFGSRKHLQLQRDLIAIETLFELHHLQKSLEDDVVQREKSTSVLSSSFFGLGAAMDRLAAAVAQAKPPVITVTDEQAKLLDATMREFTSAVRGPIHVVTGYSKDSASSTPVDRVDLTRGVDAAVEKIVGKRPKQKKARNVIPKRCVTPGCVLPSHHGRCLFQTTGRKNTFHVGQGEARSVEEDQWRKAHPDAKYSPQEHSGKKHSPRPAGYE